MIGALNFQKVMHNDLIRVNHYTRYINKSALLYQLYKFEYSVSDFVHSYTLEMDLLHSQYNFIKKVITILEVIWNVFRSMPETSWGSFGTSIVLRIYWLTQYPETYFTVMKERLYLNNNGIIFWKIIKERREEKRRDDIYYRILPEILYIYTLFI